MRIFTLLLSIFLISSLNPWMPQALPNDPVLDMDGHILQSRTQYYMLPAFNGQGGGGLILAFRNGRCPMNVAQQDSAQSSGLPLTFLPESGSGPVIRESMDVKIAFAVATICVQPVAWRVSDMDRATGQRYVTTGPGVSLVSNSFKIERFGDGYKLRSCTSGCGDIGVVIENGKTWLALSDVGFPFVFKKV